MPVKLHLDCRRRGVVWQSLILLLMVASAANLLPPALAQTPQAQATATQKDTTASISLAELQRLALQNHPTVAQAEAAIRAAEGRKQQAGLLPNPTIGYRGEEFAFRAFSDKSEHFFFFEQEIPLGGKLKKSRNIFEQERLAAVSAAETERRRLLNTVQTLYYQTLGLQKIIETRSELSKITAEAVRVSEELMNVGQADKPDQLAVEVEAQKDAVELLNSENALAQSWQVLAATIGNPAMPQIAVEGDVEKDLPALDNNNLLQTILSASPEVKTTRANLERARAALERAKAERTPDLILRGGFGYSTEKLEHGSAPFPRRTGPEANVEIGFRVPLFNRNQGGIKAAEAEVVIAENEVRRVELSIRSRFATAMTAYQNAARTVARYRDDILPRSQKAYQLYATSFAQMAAAYPQVLIAKRAFYQNRLAYLNALVQLRQQAARLQGYLLTGDLNAPGSDREAGNSSVMMEGGRSHE
jgi:outer membrane protein, heavy metal efflux system